MTGGYLQTAPTSPNAELYDPATGVFIVAGAYAGASAKYLLMATLLADGRVSINGCTTDESGCDYGGNETQLYDPVTDRFRLGAMTYAYTSGTDTLLPNGEVLFGGGDAGDFMTSSSTLYDPSTESITRAADMTKARDNHTATLLPDGRVLITGGAGLGAINQSTELYDPSTGSFTSAGNMTAQRSYHTATLLPDGRVLIAGGRTPGLLSSAELYTPPVLVPAPVLLSLSGDGRGQGAIWHAATGQVASAFNPAIAGEALSMYTSSLVDGGVIPPQVAVGGRLAEILFFGKAPGCPGFNQVNFRMPSSVAPDPKSPVRLFYIGRPSNEVTIGVQ